MTRHEWMLQMVDERAASRPWGDHPQDFEIAAVRQTFKRLLPYFEKRDIRSRINANEAQTFVELREAVNKQKYAK